MATMNDTTSAGLRAWAKGVYATEAAAELLVRSGLAAHASFLSDRSQPLIEIRPDWIPEVMAGYSASEQEFLSVIISLLGDTPVDLSRVFSYLDRNSAQLVLAALSHASGAHEQPDGPFVTWPA